MKRLSIIFLIIVGLTAACSEDFLETAPTNQISDADVFESVQGCQTVLDGVLRDMRAFRSNHDQFGVKALDLAMDLMGEDMVQSRHHWFGFDYRLDNNQATYRRPGWTWSQFYRIINNVNNIIVNIDEATGTDPAQKANVKAQALALRGYAYHNLAEMFQQTYAANPSALGVPVYTEPTTEGNPRAPLSEVYQRAADDLDEAVSLMTANPAGRRHISDINLNVAHGLRARVALYMEDWTAARDHAAAARQGVDINSRAQYAAGFDSYQAQNWLWGLEINDEQSTIYASLFSHLDMSVPGYTGLYLSPKLASSAMYDQMVDGDIRKELIGNYTIAAGIELPYVNLKFNAGRPGGKNFAADYVMMRPEEMLLIEAEARWHLNDYTGAQGLLKELRDNRYDAPATVTETGQALLDEILFERRIELWGEGFRMRDIRRLQIPLDRTGSNHLDYDNNPLYLELPANSPLFIYQIPQTEIDNNPNITTEDQNPL
ncbi:MAG: RagB/SusD family nutrient uptake outer membrane protein [Bacteroidales bacterium]